MHCTALRIKSSLLLISWHLLSSLCHLQGSKFEYLLNTGNLASRSGLDLSQSTGFTVVAEKLNFFRWESFQS